MYEYVYAHVYLAAAHMDAPGDGSVIQKRPITVSKETYYLGASNGIIPGAEHTGEFYAPLPPVYTRRHPSALAHA